MTCTTSELRAVLALLEPYRAERVTTTTLALALRLARLTRMEATP